MFDRAIFAKAASLSGWLRIDGYGKNMQASRLENSVDFSKSRSWVRYMLKHILGNKYIET